MSDKIAVSMWVDDSFGDQKHLEKAWAQMRSTRPCLSPHLFDYWYDEDATWRFVNQSCIPVCHQGLQHMSCLNKYDTYIDEGDGVVFIVTHVQDTFLGHRQAQDLDASHFVPGAETLSLDIAYGYNVPGPNVLSGLSSYTISAENAVRHSSRNLTTVILDSYGDVWKEEPPQSHINLKITDLLYLAGLPQALDTPQPLAGANKIPNANISEGPIARISGLQLFLNVMCFNNHTGTNSCLLKVTAGSRKWLRRSDLQLLNNASYARHRKYRGIEISYRTGGFFHYTSLNAIILHITSALVLLSLPTKFMLFVMSVLLGPLSSIYRKIIYEDLVVRRSTCNMLMNLLCHSASFSDLMDTHQSNSGGAGLISQTQCAEQLLEAMPVATTREERNRIVNFVFSSIQDSCRTQLDSKRDVEEQCAKEQAALDLQSFTAACSYLNPKIFTDIIHIFDPSRQHGLLEWIFMPTELRTPRNASGTSSTKATAERKQSTECSAGSAQEQEKDEERSCAGSLRENKEPPSIAKTLTLPSSSRQPITVRQRKLLEKVRIEEECKELQGLLRRDRNHTELEQAHQAQLAESVQKLSSLELRVASRLNLLEEQAKADRILVAQQEAKLMAIVCDLQNKCSDLQEELSSTRNQAKIAQAAAATAQTETAALYRRMHVLEEFIERRDNRLGLLVHYTVTVLAGNRRHHRAEGLQ